MIIVEQNLINLNEQVQVYRITESGAIIQTGGGTGDMTKAIYDPNAVGGDAFDMENMVEGATSKIFTGAERAKLEADIKLVPVDATGGLINVSSIAAGDQYDITTGVTTISAAGVTLANPANNESIAQLLAFNAVNGTLFAVGAFPSGTYIDPTGTFQAEPVFETASTFARVIAVSERSASGILTIIYYMEQGVQP